ncbi:MAG TPA: PxKF domain-containing protein, partial [Gemmataceae bacterium]
SASINWGDGTASQPDITSGVISYSATTGIFTVSGAHTYANVGTYPITVVIEHFNAFPVTVSSSASIAPVTPTVTVSDAGGTYNGNPFPATGKAVGVDGTTAVSGSFTYAYYAGTSTTGTSSATAPTDAGTYTVVATFSSSDPNYTDGTAQTIFTINKAATAFSILAVQQVAVGTGATTVSGQLTSSTIVPFGQSVAITLNGVTQSASVGANGAFSVSFATSALGVGKYTVTYNYAGNINFTAASAIGSLTVGYGTQLLFNNTKPVHSGAALPIKLALTDANGTDISSASIAVTATSLVDANGNSVSLKCEGNSNPNGLFRYDHGLGGYIFNLDTKGLAAGTYTLYYTVGNDATKHSLTFVVD